MKRSQEDSILKYLARGKKLTPLKALRKFGCLRLSGRIYDLKHKGYRIKSEMVKTKSDKYVAEYSMI